MQKWLGYDFNTQGWSVTKENHSDAFDNFVKDLRAWYKKYMPSQLQPTERIRRNHFIVNVMTHNLFTNKFAFWAMSDVRYFQDHWYTHILYRTAENATDWKGGINQYCRLPELPFKLLEITREREK